MLRLDKVLSDSGIGSRSDCSKLVKHGRVSVDGEIIKDPSRKISENAKIEIDGEIIERSRGVILMMNKPKGYVTSTDDPRDLTVMSLVKQKYQDWNVVPAGRLDKDTEGLLLLSNNGKFIHRVISPKMSIPKTYQVEFEGIMTEAKEKEAQAGVILKDGTICAPAKIKVSDETHCTITITEGKYHEVKRIFASLGCHVMSLKRISIGKLSLGNLDTADVRELTTEEIQSIFE